MVNGLFLAATFLVSLCLTAFILPAVIRKAMVAGMIGHDMNKLNTPPVAEMGGLAILIGVMGSLLLAVALHTFFGYSLNTAEMLAALSTMMLISMIGLYDDLFDMRKDVKTLLPMVAALPMIAIAAAGSTTILLPFVGAVDFGILYIVLLIPLGITVAANLTNMLAGFNGMEAGMGIVIFVAVAIIAVANGSTEAALIAAAMLGSLLAFLYFNWYPAKIFIGDIGALFIGGALAVAVIIGNFESVGAILVIPYLADFAIKIYNKFPSKEWWGELTLDGKLHPLGGKVRGLCQLIMKWTGGITEQQLVKLFIGIEIIFALITILLYGGIM